MKAVDTAMGPLKGDYLEIRNQWAAIILSRGDPRYGGIYMVSGDSEQRRLPSPESALAYALEVLSSAQARRHPPINRSVAPGPSTAEHEHIWLPPHDCGDDRCVRTGDIVCSICLDEKPK
jgi:hypothetical protein